MSKPRIVVVVQARMGSSRLPGKSLMALAGRPLLQHVLQRARAIHLVDEVVLATGNGPGDDPLEALGSLCNVPVVRGSEWDVLDRVRLAAMRHQAEVVVRVTGDCPFLAPEVAHEVLKAYLTEPLGVHYVSNDTTCSGYPDGTDVEVFSWAALDEASRRAHARPDREHVTQWMRRNMMTGMIKAPEGSNWAHWKLSVDTADDYRLAAAIAAQLGRENTDLWLPATIAAAQAVTAQEGTR